MALLDEDVRRVAEELVHIASDDELDDWEQRLFKTVIRKAEVLPLDAYTSTSSSSRARCPLCGSGSSAPYEVGFALPDGLDRHLRGHGNSRRCVVTNFLWRTAQGRLQKSRP